MQEKHNVEPAMEKHVTSSSKLWTIKICVVLIAFIQEENLQISCLLVQDPSKVIFRARLKDGE